MPEIWWNQFRIGTTHGRSRINGRRSAAAVTDAGSERDPHETETREELLNQFYATLGVMYLAAQPGTGAGTVSQHGRIHELLYQLPGRGRAYEIEQLLAFVMTDDQVAAELPRRVAEARALDLQYVAQIEAQFDAALKVVQDPDANDASRKQSQAAMRYILQRLLNDLQWLYHQRIRRREAAKRLSVRVSALFLSAFFFFVCLLFTQYFSNPLDRASKVQGSSNVPRPYSEVTNWAGPVSHIGRIMPCLH
jgi:hypothetical protein